jgi:ABC-type branched-subunit amino acid transport system substrate-binding protein
MAKKLWTAVAVFVGIALFAAACGSSGSSKANSGNLIDKNVQSAVQANGTTSSQVAGKEPTSMDEWEALWKSERDAIVARIKQNKWGLQADGKTLVGPDNFKVDLSKCPAGWNNTEGLSDTEIKFGATAPASGTAATGVYINQSMSVILDYYSDKGLFTDSLGKKRKVTQTIRDDGYDPARTVPLMDELIDSQKVFEVQSQGSPSTFKTYEKLNQRCIPDFFNTTGHPAWGDPVNHPWTTGFLFPYNIEALLWGDIISQHLSEFPGGKMTVAALVMNNDFGKVYEQAFKAYLAQSPNKDKISYVSELFEPQAATVTNEMTTLASKKPDAFIGMLTGTPCAQSIIESAQNGMNKTTKYKFLSIGCKSATYLGKAAVGDAADGWYIVGGGMRDISSSAEDNNVYSKWARALLTSKGFDYKASGYYSWGLANGWSRAQVLAVAGMLDGGLTRANYLTAMRSMDMTPAAYYTGLRLTMSGNKDAYWVEGSEIGKYDASLQQLVVQGDILDLSGKSKACAWNQGTSSCE